MMSGAEALKRREVEDLLLGTTLLLGEEGWE